ncbi:50S ribosomal protein L18 [Candidatus Pacearchaeota archaeon]|nr:50S ribosomal protein L18 [Candidatus Pacearchaeota archaeon]
MRVKKKRRMQGKTDYRARIALLKSRKPRIAVRKTNRYIIAEYITSEDAQDRVLYYANSKELLNYGWPSEMQGSLKSLSACYLTGKLLAEKIKKKEGKKKEKDIEAVLDIGLARNIPKSRIYAALKGIIDGGISISCKKEILPEEGRIKGAHLKKDVSKIFEKIKENIENEKRKQ